MSIDGIVGEYNPFHNGHAYHLQKTRELLGEASPVVCVMSGDFVQRGEAAVYSKFARAEAACRSGVDLVIELPLPWALSSAEGFARGAVSLLAGLGCKTISFGSESGEVEPLEQLAQALITPGMNGRIKERLAADASLSYAAARQLAAADVLGGETARLLESPNNILAVEYLKAIYELRTDLQPVTVPRFGSGHDQTGGGGPKSASEIRRMMANGKSVAAELPESAAAIYFREDKNGRGRPDRQAIEIALLSRLRWLDERDFERLPDAQDGLGRRLYRAVREEPTLDAVMAAAKTKRYALSRIRRMLFCAALGVTAETAQGLPPYARVLAANSCGCELLREAGRRTALPIVTKPAAVKELDRACYELFTLGARAHDLYVLGYRAAEERRGGGDWRTSPVIL